MSTQLYPEVIDGSTLGAKYSQPLFLPVGVEGQAMAPGTAVLGSVYSVERPSESDTLFGATSPLGTLVKALLGRGVRPVIATVSKFATTPTLAERQAAWGFLESNKDIRIRMTDSVIQADLDALATSCENAGLINHKQFAIVGLASGITKANLITAAGAIASKRACLVGPGVYDTNGVLLSGIMAAAAVAAEVAKNPDPGDDLDWLTLPNLLAIEKDAGGLPVFRIKVSVGAVVTNDFEDLLDGGVSPLQPTRDGGGVAISHLRTTYTVDATHDALSTLIIADQIFVLVREYCYEFNYLRKQNTPATRAMLKAGVTALLEQHADWVRPKVQADGALGYSVEVTSSPDEKQIIVAYEGAIVRNTQTILVNQKLEVPV
jgi:hypothetical protein